MQSIMAHFGGILFSKRTCMLGGNLWSILYGDVSVMPNQNFKCLVLLKMDRPVYYHRLLNLINTTLLPIFLFQKVDFCIFTQKAED